MLHKMCNILCFSIKGSYWSILISALELCAVCVRYLSRIIINPKRKKYTHTHTHNNPFHFIHSRINEIHLHCSSENDKKTYIVYIWLVHSIKCCSNINVAHIRIIIIMRAQAYTTSQIQCVEPISFPFTIEIILPKKYIFPWLTHDCVSI